MFSHVMLGADDIDASKKFYDAVIGAFLDNLEKNDDGSDDLKKGTQLLEVYALEIQMYTETKNSKRLKSLYNKALQIKSAIPHPKVRVRARVRVS